MARTVHNAAHVQPLHLVLASASPRRRALLTALRVPFSTVHTTYDEPHQPHLSPPALARYHARQKLRYALAHVSAGVVLTADTVVALGEMIFGKPRSLTHAYDMLKALQGRTHRVYTAIAVYDTASGRRRSACVCTKVTMRSLSHAEIVRYCELINPLDKAGAYAIQDAGSAIIERIEGCYYNVMGLPIVTLEKLLRSLGYSLLFPAGFPRQPSFAS